MSVCAIYPVIFHVFFCSFFPSRRLAAAFYVSSCACLIIYGLNLFAGAVFNYGYNEEVDFDEPQMARDTWAPRVHLAMMKMEKVIHLSSRKP